MSNNDLGDPTGDAEKITAEANGAISAGDAVAIKQDATEGRYPVIDGLQDSTTPNVDQEAGVAVDDFEDGEIGTIVLSGPVIANVASGINQGERLGAGATEGQFASQDDGPVLALSGEGGTDRAGTSLGANEAEVYL